MKSGAYTLIFSHSKLPLAIVASKFIADALVETYLEGIVEIRPAEESDYHYIETGGFES